MDDAYLPDGHFDTPEGSVYIPSEAELAAAHEEYLNSLNDGDAADRKVIRSIMDDKPEIHHKPLPGWNAEVERTPYHWERVAAELAAVKADLTALLAYNWNDEERDYYANLVEYDDKTMINDTHIFPAMQRLNDWVTSL